MSASTENPNPDSASFVYGIEHIVVVYSPSGGAGTTTIATNLAAALMSMETRVLLVDCHPQFGQVDVFLNIQSGTNFVDLAKQIESLDIDFVNNHLITCYNGMRVLTAPVHPEYSRGVASHDITDLVATLASIFDVIIVDTPAQIGELTSGLFEIAERILLVTNPTLPSIRSTRVLLDMFSEMGEPAQFVNKITHVLNRVSSENQHDTGTVPVSSIVKHLKIVDHVIVPQDERTVMVSINRGVPLVDSQPTALLAHQIMQLAIHVRERLGLPVVEDKSVKSPTVDTRPPSVISGSDTVSPNFSAEEHDEEAKPRPRIRKPPVQRNRHLSSEKERGLFVSDQGTITTRTPERHENEPVSYEKIKILIADDNLQVREIIRELLVSESVFDVVGIANTGQEAIEKAIQLKPDVILLEANMPDVDGVTATMKISKGAPASAVIIMSTQSDSSMLRKAMLAGVRDFLSKPISSEELFATLRRTYDRNAPIRNREMQGFSISDHSETARVAPSATASGLVRKPITRIEVIGISDKTEEKQPKQEATVFEGNETTAETVLEEITQYSAFYPEFVQASQHYVLMVFAHLQTALDEISRIAAGFEGLMGGKVKQDSIAGATRVSLGSLLTFVPQIEGMVFNPTEYIVTWKAPFQSGNFLFSTPAQLDADLRGRVLVYQGPLIIGEIPIEMKLFKGHAARAKTIAGRSDFERFDPIFASYSHKDMPVMEYFRQSRENLGQKMLVDIYDLRAGEQWQDRLYEMIDESAVFQLFWSEHSAQSEYCQREWRYALRYQDNRPRFIQPVWWKAPMPSPPSELAHLHFQKVKVLSET